MPVHRSTFFWLYDVVVDRDLDPVAPVRFNEGSWKLAIDQDNIAEDSIGTDLTSGYREVIVLSGMEEMLLLLAGSPSAQIWEVMLVVSKRVRHTCCIIQI